MASNPVLDQILSYANQASCGSSSSNYSTFNYESCADNPNRCQPHDFACPLPLDQYRLHDDPNPEIIHKKPTERINYTQNVAVRYLKPPAPAPAGDIVIQQLPDRQVAPAPPLHVRKQQPSRPNPAPLVIREAPPPPPPPIPGQYHEV